MKKLSILTQENPSAQWKEWIDALADTHLIVEEINSNPTDYEALVELQSDVILLDGMLQQLSQIIIFLRAHHSGIRIVVASEANSFALLYEIWSLGENDYLPGPMDSNEFKAVIQNMLSATESPTEYVAAS